MFEGSQLVHWLDTVTREATRDTLVKLVSAYSHKITTVDNDRVCLVFITGGAVKLTDWKGWSDIVSIKGSRSLLRSYVIKTEGGKELRGSADAMVPVYEAQTIVKGFHGETKYPHRVTQLYDLKVGDTLRVLHLSNDAGDSIDFDKISHIDCIVSVEPGSGYEVCTKSKYMNVGDIYVFAGTDEDARIINTEQFKLEQRTAPVPAADPSGCVNDTGCNNCCCNGCVTDGCPE